MAAAVLLLRPQTGSGHTHVGVSLPMRSGEHRAMRDFTLATTQPYHRTSDPSEALAIVLRHEGLMLMCAAQLPLSLQEGVQTVLMVQSPAVVCSTAAAPFQINTSLQRQCSDCRGDCSSATVVCSNTWQGSILRLQKFSHQAESQKKKIPSC